MRNETVESVIVVPGPQFFVVSVEDTSSAVPGMPHSEGGRSQAHCDMQGILLELVPILFRWMDIFYFSQVQEVS